MSEKEYIERGALSKFVRDVRRKLPKDSKDFFTRDEMLLNFQQYVDWQPAADVEPVVLTERKEKVYHIDGEDHVGIVCGNCDASQFAGLGNAQRCYNCGAHFGAYGKERER